MSDVTPILASIDQGDFKALIEKAKPEERKLLDQGLERTRKEFRAGKETRMKTLFLRILGL